MIKKVNKKLFYVILISFFLVNIFYNNLYSYSYNNSINLGKKTEYKSIKGLSTNQGFISEDNYNLFWFIQITDTHFSYPDVDKIASFYQLLNETYNQIDPLFIYHTGDLVEAYLGLQQDSWEWSVYQKALEDNIMNASNYMDVIGNHDASQDPNFTYFLNYSMMGRIFNTTQYSFNKSFDFGNYAFIGLNTAKESYNLIEFGFQGSLNSDEMNWYEYELEKYKNSTKIFVFGHHPPNFPPYYTINSEENVNGKDFYELNEEYNVSYYISGHVHENSFYYSDDLITITTDNFECRGGTYKIICLDNNSLSTSIEDVGDWPQAIITCPANEKYLFEDLNNHHNKIRILAWDPKGIKSVNWSLFDSQGEFQLTNWKILNNISKNSILWEGKINFEFGGDIILKIRVEGGSGITIKELRYNLGNQISFNSLVVAVLMTIGLVSISIIINYYLFKRFKTSEIIARERS
ncbi:MAG: metallophosphoesterase [Promethearchaeota archaeon]|nr:MAG: metallophosphoesterase [Candidatus Lokiarchaeota archaeon]